VPETSYTPADSRPWLGTKSARPWSRRSTAGIASKKRTIRTNRSLDVSQLLWRADRAGTQIGALCNLICSRQGELSVRRILGVLSLAKKVSGFGIGGFHLPVEKEGDPDHGKERFV